MYKKNKRIFDLIFIIFFSPIIIIITLTVGLIIKLTDISNDIFYKQERVGKDGKLFLICFIFSLFYHLANGIRHLFWDAGFGLEISTTYISGYITVVVSITLTLVTLFLGGVI